jgi:hypothetical protein
MYTEAQLLQQIALARSHGTAADPRVLEACQLLADWYVGVGNHTEAARRWRLLIAELDELPTAKLSDKAVARVRLADVLEQQTDLEGAQAALWEAIDLLRAEPEPPRVDLAFVLNQLAEVSFALGRPETSLTASKHAAGLLIGVVGEAHVELIRTRNNLAAVHGSRGEFTLADRLFRQNLKALSAAYGEHDIALIVPAQNLAGLYRRQGRVADAEEWLTRAHQLATRRLGGSHPFTIHGLTLQADLQTFVGDYSAAERLWRQVLQVRRELLRPGHPFLTQTLLALGELLIERGRPREAEPLLDEALRNQDEHGQRTHPLTARVWAALSRVYHAAGRWANAERAALQALGQQQLTLHPHDLSIVDTYHQLARLALARHDVRRAREQCELARERLAAATRVEPEVRLRLLLVSVRVALAANARDLAGTELAAARELRAAPSVPLIDRITYRQLEAELALADGRLDEADDHCRRAFALFERLPTHPLEPAAELAGVGAAIALRRNEPQAAYDYALQAVEFRERLGQQETLAMVPARMQLARANELRGELAEAEPHLLKALALAERGIGTPPGLVAELIERLAALQLARRDFAGFKPWMRRSLKLLEAAEGDAQTETQEAWIDTLRAAGETAEADELTDQLLALRNRQSHVLGDLL